MLSLLGSLAHSWIEGSGRALQGLRRGLTEPYPVEEDPEPVTPYEVVHESRLLRLRRYPAERGGDAPPVLLVYSVIKRPYILDLLPGKSVVRSLLAQGLTVYLTDWRPPRPADAGCGLDAYVSHDLASAARWIQRHHRGSPPSVVGYCAGGLFAVVYASLHPRGLRSLTTLTLPLDMSVRELATDVFMEHFRPTTIDSIAAVYGNCPAWLVHAGFTAMAPLHHTLDKYMALYRNRDRESYRELFDALETWLESDVPLSTQLLRELVNDVFRKNLLVQNRLRVGSRTADLGRIVCPVLNVVGDADDVVHPKASLPLENLVGSVDKRTILFPGGHIAPAISGAAHKRLWPEIGAWIRERAAAPAGPAPGNVMAVRTT